MKYTFLTYDNVNGVKGTVSRKYVDVVVLAESDEEANQKVRRIITKTDYELRRIEE